MDRNPRQRFARPIPIDLLTRLFRAADEGAEFRLFIGDRDQPLPAVDSEDQVMPPQERVEKRVDVFGQQPFSGRDRCRRQERDRGSSFLPLRHAIDVP